MLCFGIFSTVSYTQIGNVCVALNHGHFNPETLAITYIARHLCPYDVVVAYRIMVFHAISSEFLWHVTKVQNILCKNNDWYKQLPLHRS